MEKIACPRCGSYQNFGIQKRIISEELEEHFIRCSMCRYESVVISDHPDRIHHYKEFRKLRERAKRDPRLRKIMLRKARRLKDE